MVVWIHEAHGTDKLVHVIPGSQLLTVSLAGKNCRSKNGYNEKDGNANNEYPSFHKVPKRPNK
jgi:hypothetical protein